MASVTDCCQRMGNFRSPSNKSWSIEDFLKLILDATIILVNTANDSCLDKIPKDLVERFLQFLLVLRDKSNYLTFTWNWKGYFKLTSSSLAMTIFKLSMNQTKPVLWDFNKIKTNFFGSGKSDFENFLLNYWENSPFLLNSTLRDLERNDSVFCSLLHSFDHRTIDDILDMIFLRSVSCPPIASDVLDINFFLNELNGSFGSSIIYGEDFRVLKAQQVDDGLSNIHVKNEIHLFGTTSSISINDELAQECKEAFHNGFTVAVRGMELRIPFISVVVEGLADLFGQPSVGVNLYLTPPRSQGLACHYDDHCVFVWQLLGKKRWAISSCAADVLPRLYKPLTQLTMLDEYMNGHMQVSLNKGDMLYIPRGFAHEAHTLSNSCGSHDDDFSLHLTFAVEVEPPFEWEGFMHIALHCWHEKQKQNSTYVLSSRTIKLQVMSILMLHVGIRIVADCTPIFRKACLVGAKFLSSEKIVENIDQHSLLNQRAIFCHLTSTINASCSFKEAYTSIQHPVQQRKDDSFQWMRWLRHLPQNENKDQNIDFDKPFEAIIEHFESYTECTGELATQFSQTKHTFFEFVEYEEVCKSFIMLLERYKKTRRKYVEGMLSLHSI